MQIGPVPLRQDYARPISRPDSSRSSRPTSGPDSVRPPGQTGQPADDQNLGRDRPISPFADWSSFAKMPTRLALEEEEVIAINSESDSDYVPPESVYKAGSPRPEPIEETPEDPRPGPPREEGPGTSNIFTDSPRGRERGPPREEGPDFTDSARARERGRDGGIPGVPVQHVSPFFRGSGNRRNFLGRVRPM